MDRPFQLDERLAHDCHRLASLPFSDLLLMNNALIPWFILVPRTEATELYQLPQSQQLALLDEINLVSRFIEQHYSPHKLNVAAIGNIVRQMHIHLVARSEDDICWPGVVWGATRRERYRQSQLDAIALQLNEFLPEQTPIYAVSSKP
jgi:diadenosine tetraphosphate (Ap4A) HIT family hydrolase